MTRQLGMKAHHARNTTSVLQALAIPVLYPSFAHHHFGQESKIGLFIIPSMPAFTVMISRTAFIPRQFITSATKLPLMHQRPFLGDFGVAAGTSTRDCSWGCAFDTPMVLFQFPTSATPFKTLHLPPGHNKKQRVASTAHLFLPSLVCCYDNAGGDLFRLGLGPLTELRIGQPNIGQAIDYFAKAFYSTVMADLDQLYSPTVFA